MLEQLIHKEAIAFEAVAVQSWTRESFVAVDDNTNSQYRLVLRVV
jgi:6-phosphofructokinase 2